MSFSESLAVRWMTDLCSIETSTGDEGRIVPALQSLLEGLGACVELGPIDEGRFNILARWGSARVLLSSHVDTVPPYVPFHFDGEAFHGRGTCDAKGQIVAQLLAIHGLLEKGIRDLAWLGVVGEETGSDGARAAAVHWKPLREECDLVINGEPTELKLATGQRGTSRYRLSCEGVSTHSGSPELGKNAIWILIHWLEELQRKELPVDRVLGSEIWNLGVIRGGSASNVVPGHAEAEVMARCLFDSRFESALEETKPMEGAWERQSKTMPSLFYTPPGFEQTIVPFGSDAPHVGALSGKDRVILCGPGTIKVAHTPEERLSMADLLAGADLFTRLVKAEMAQ
jgi:acetylornithine deacetylase